MLALDFALQQPGMGLTLADIGADEYAGIRILHEVRAAKRERDEENQSRERRMQEARDAGRRR